MNYVKELNNRNHNKPFLYSYRRCPYAIRARMALISASIDFEIFEISLRKKPKEMLKISPKGTVPILINGKDIIDESLDIMYWAYSVSDQSNHYKSLSQEEIRRSKALIVINDNDFKFHLDKYKYSSNGNELSSKNLYKSCLFFIDILEKNLLDTNFLVTNNLSYADIAIFPFIRQFANINLEQFMKNEFKRTREWLSTMTNENFFLKAMEKPIYES